MEFGSALDTIRSDLPTRVVRIALAFSYLNLGTPLISGTYDIGIWNAGMGGIRLIGISREGSAHDKPMYDTFIIIILGNEWNTTRSYSVHIHCSLFSLSRDGDGDDDF